LQNSPHILYLAHDTLLALSGKSGVDVTFELTTPGSEPLDVRWEYWDGKVWREFKAMRPMCREEGEETFDSTAGLTRSGKFHLETDCAQTAKTTVNGVEAFWVRGWVTQTLPPDPARVLPEVESIKFSTEIARPLAVDWRFQSKLSEVEKEYHVFVKVRDEAGAPLHGIKVTDLTIPLGPKINPLLTDVKGECSFRMLAGMNNTVVVSLGEFQQAATFTPDPQRP